MFSVARISCAGLAGHGRLQDDTIGSPVDSQRNVSQNEAHKRTNGGNVGNGGFQCGNHYVKMIRPRFVLLRRGSSNVPVSLPKSMMMMLVVVGDVQQKKKTSKFQTCFKSNPPCPVQQAWSHKHSGIIFYAQPPVVTENESANSLKLMRVSTISYDNFYDF